MFLAIDQLNDCLKSLNSEQRLKCFEAANLSLSAKRLRQRLIIFKRYFIALNRFQSNKPSVVIDQNKTLKCTKTDPLTVKNDSKFKPSIKSLDHATTGLARIGSRAALNFSFAFLKRAWRLGKKPINITLKLKNELLKR